MITNERKTELGYQLMSSLGHAIIKSKNQEEIDYIYRTYKVQKTVEQDPNFPISTPYKDKKGKLRFDLIPPEMDKAWAEVGTFGIQKLKEKGVQNPERNWERGLKLVADHLAAVKRHINEWELGANGDKESKLNPLKHALWHMAAMVAQIDRGRIDLDDRPNKIDFAVEENPDPFHDRHKIDAPMDPKDAA